MRYLLSLAVLVCSATYALAAKEVAIVPPGDGPVIIVTVDDEGGVTYRYVQRAKPVGPEPPPVPPEELTERGKEVRDAALEIDSPSRAECAASLAEINREVIKMNIEGQKLKAFAIKVGYDKFLEAKEQKEQWTAVRSVMSEHWNALVQEGGTDADFDKLLTEHAAGLDAAAGENVQIDLAMILMIIKLILELIDNFTEGEEAGLSLVPMGLTPPTEVCADRPKWPYYALSV